MARKRPRTTVRPGSRWGPKRIFLVCAVVFAVVSAAVYGWGSAKGDGGATSTYTSTARILYIPAPQIPTANGRTATTALPEPKSIEGQITAGASVQRAVRRVVSAMGLGAPEELDAMAARVMERMRDDLKVAVSQGREVGELAISVVYTNADGQYAARLANALAENWASDCRAAWRQQAAAAYAAAKAAAQSAHEKWTTAQAELDRFVERSFRQQGPTPVVPHATDRSTVEAPPPPQAPASPPTVENPEWADLNEQLLAQRRRRDDLLIDRTPAHPEVQNTELRIAALEEQLAATPKQIQDPADTVPPAREQAPPQPGPLLPNAAPQQTGRQDIETAAAFARLKAVVDETAQRYAEAATMERRAAEAALREPRIELELAEAIPVPLPRRSALALMLVAVAAGLAAAGGAGMVASRLAVEPTLNTVAEVEKAIAVPVVGTVPWSDGGHMRSTALSA